MVSGHIFDICWQSVIYWLLFCLLLWNKIRNYWLYKGHPLNKTKRRERISRQTQKEGWLSQSQGAISSSEDSALSWYCKLAYPSSLRELIPEPFKWNVFIFTTIKNTNHSQASILDLLVTISVPHSNSHNNVWSKQWKACSTPEDTESPRQVRL